MPWTCFMVEDADVFDLYLRRYARREYRPDIGWTCAEGWHQAKVRIKPVSATWTIDEAGRKYIGISAADSWPHDDKRWPKTCESCDYQFTPDDHWQLFPQHFWRRPGGDELWTIEDLPIGAMWWATYLSPPELCVKLPPGGMADWWDIDGPAKDGGRWTRTGEPPTVSATPSILTPRYHGFLTGGVLTDPI